MKTKYWYWIGAGITVFILLASSLIPVVAFKKDLWWIWGTLIFCSTIWLIVLIVYLVNLTGKKPQLEKIELDDAVLMVKQYSIHHPDNPDNFLLKQHYTIKVGEAGAERTPILILQGHGTELSESRYFIINKEDKTEFDMLVEPSQKELNEKIIQIAKSQPNPIVTEQVQATDSFGRPITKYITKTTSRAEIKKEEEIRKAEEESAL